MKLNCVDELGLQSKGLAHSLDVSSTIWSSLQINHIRAHAGAELGAVQKHRTSKIANAVRARHACQHRWIADQLLQTTQFLSIALAAAAQIRLGVRLADLHPQTHVQIA